ncbi:unnamed protein product [Cuscuta europaea]|uniref:Ultraviolet-B-repressible protein n=1 Tax=Cuscuta europaea TaxID=41803 RepID=A0A9P0YKY6_CUSEU|nr:unnamed protein product [Cuscuta europaea]
MASTCAVSMVMPPLTVAAPKRQPTGVAVASFLKPMLPAMQSKPIVASKPTGKFEVRASLKDKAVTGLTAAALTASLVTPEVAEAADSISPSLKNFLLSIVAGGLVVAVIAGVVIGVSNFDPVKRG